MKLSKLQLDLITYIKLGERILRLEEHKKDIARKRILKEDLTKLELFPTLETLALAEWKYLYEKELSLELEILELKKAQTKYLLDRLLTE